MRGDQRICRLRTEEQLLDVPRAGWGSQGGAGLAVWVPRSCRREGQVWSFILELGTGGSQDRWVPSLWARGRRQGVRRGHAYRLSLEERRHEGKESSRRFYRPAVKPLVQGHTTRKGPGVDWTSCLKVRG